MRNWDPTRRTLLGGIAGAATIGLAAGARAQSSPPAPSSPLTLNVVDVAGNLALTQRAFELYRRKNPKMVVAFRLQPGARRPSCPARSRRSRMRAASISTWC